jgi:hypothetical protein
MKTKAEYSYILRWVKRIKAIELLGGKCENCGETKKHLLLFHHKQSEEKENELNELWLSSWSIIEKETQKCSLLCHNCHRELHHIDNNSNKKACKKIFFEFKNIDKCNNCSYSKCNDALDFHHLNVYEKEFEFRNLHNKKYLSINDIEKYILEELNKCIVLCSNCHIDLHFDKEKFKKYENEILNWKHTEYKKPINKEEVMKLYNNGVRLIDISKNFNRNKSVIHGIIKRYTAGG